MAQQAVLLGVGDVGPIHEPIEGYGELVRDTLLTSGGEIVNARVRSFFVLEPQAPAAEPGGGTADR